MKTKALLNSESVLGFHSSHLNKRLGWNLADHVPHRLHDSAPISFISFCRQGLSSRIIMRPDMFRRHAQALMLASCYNHKGTLYLVSKHLYKYQSIETVACIYIQSPWLNTVWDYIMLELKLQFWVTKRCKYVCYRIHSFTANLKSSPNPEIRPKLKNTKPQNTCKWKVLNVAKTSES